MHSQDPSIDIQLHGKRGVFHKLRLLPLVVYFKTAINKETILDLWRF
jgi:hypothetical protein